MNDFDFEGIFESKPRKPSLMTMIELFEAEQNAKKYKTEAERIKAERWNSQEILSWWQLEDKLKKEGTIKKGQALAFFCPVYFAGQEFVKRLDGIKDETGETLVFPLPSIDNPQRIETGLEMMKLLGIKNPEKVGLNEDGHLKTYSTLIGGFEGIFRPEGSYEWQAYEAVQLGAFQIVPIKWLNAGDPYNTSYKIPGEEGYSPYWRIPTYEEFDEIRPDLAKSWKKGNKGWAKKYKPM